MKYIYLFTISLLFITCKNEGNSTSTASTSKTVKKATANKLDQIDGNQVLMLDGTKTEIPYWNDKDALILYLVRHAEKKEDSDNPDLTAEGKERAKHLSIVTRNANIDKVYQSGMKRTFQTALPSLQANGVASEMYDPHQLTKLVDGLLENDKGKKYLVVGHSNTTPAIMNHLLGKMVYKNIPHEEYDNLYIVATKGIGDTQIIEVKY